MAFSFDMVDFSSICASATFRCDPRYYASRFSTLDTKIRSGEFFEIGAFLPTPFVKGIQPNYLDAPGEDSVPVVNTLSIQRLSISEESCRHMPREDFDDVDPIRKLRIGDVLVTMDGGVSIGKPVLFDREGDFTVDAHVSILRPIGMEPRSLVYLLASPLGQQQFRRAESGASGQTAVTEEDIRRFVFPASILPNLDKVVGKIEQERKKIAEQREALLEREAAAWKSLEDLWA